jgi:hypothetical protein
MTGLHELQVSDTASRGLCARVQVRVLPSPIVTGAAGVRTQTVASRRADQFVMEDDWLYARRVHADSRPTRATIPTRALLISAAFASVQAIIYLALVPVLSAAAAAMPPVYALLAGVTTVAPLLTRVVTRVPGTALITAAITSALVVAVSPLGLLSAVPFLTAGLVFDLIARRGAVSTVRIFVGAAAVAVALFLISIPVFSAEHLTFGILAATLFGRLGGEGAAALLVSVTVRTLRRAGVSS